MISDTTIHYRRATIADVKLLVEYRLMFLKEMYRNMDKATKPAPITAHQADALSSEQEKALTQYFTKAIESNEFIGFLAESGNQCIGLGGMAIQVLPGNFLNVGGCQGYVLNMYTLAAFRGKGICTEILNHLIEEGKKIGLGKLVLHATEHGIEIYKRNGFKTPIMPELELKL